ncbi:MAG TPA: GNAT family N-acetyltransferase [Myxococcales bacterium]|nr:GNAT family N-acetyltransferase [Myxococcales bacterium]
MLLHVTEPGPGLEEVRALLREYWRSFGFTPCFQGFDEELESLPGGYALFLEPGAGCVAVRGLSADTAEMKRLYVRPRARGTGLGRTLAMKAIDYAREQGYRRLLLDTIADKMPQAVALYRSLGFRETAPYNDTPGALWMELRL